MYYRSVDELPIKTLFKIFETKNLLLLVKEYKNQRLVPRKELAEAWKSIEQEYNNLDESNTLERVLRVEQRIDYLIAKHQMISLCAYVLRLGRNEKVEEILKENKYKIDPNNYEESLDAIELNAESLRTKIGVKRAELERLTRDKSIDKADVNKMLASMMSSLQIGFKFNEVTVVEFFGFKAALEAKAKAQPTQKKGSSHGRR